MKNRIDHISSKNVYTGFFSLDKFIESDGPGTLSWLKIVENDLNIDIPPFREVELGLTVPPCGRNRRTQGFEKVEFRDINILK